MATNETQIDTALSNLATIKSGGDPRVESESDSAVESEPSGVAEDDALSVMRAEVDRLFETHDLGEYVDRDRVHVALAGWDRKNGQARYNAEPKQDRYGKRVSTRHVKGQHTVLVNERVFECDGRESFLDVVRHEVAHVIDYVDPSTAYGEDDSSGHGRGWKRWARALGADPSSCHNRSKDTEYKYFVGCKDGCYYNGRLKRSKTVKHPQLYSCSTCGGSVVSWRADEEPPTEALKEVVGEGGSTQ